MGFIEDFVDKKYEKARTTGNELKKDVASNVQSAKYSLQDAVDRQNILANAPYSDSAIKMRQAYGQVEDVAIEQEKKFAAQNAARKARNYADQLTLQDSVDQGLYDRPSTFEGLMIGAGELYDRAGKGLHEYAIKANPFQSDANKYEDLQSLYQRRSSDRDVNDKYIGTDQPGVRFIGGQLPYILPQVGLYAVRNAAVGLTKAASVLGEDGLKYPLLSNPGRALQGLEGNPYVGFTAPNVNTVGALANAFPSTFAKYTSTADYAPAFVSGLDKLTPGIDRLVKFAKNIPGVPQVAEIARTGTPENVVNAVEYGIRPGSNVISRTVDSLADAMYNSNSIMGAGLRGGIENGALGAIDIDQNAKNSAMAGVALSMGLQAIGNRFALPNIDPNPIAQHELKVAEDLGFNISPGAYTGHQPTQQLESAMASNSAISDQIKHKLNQTDRRATLALTNVANPYEAVPEITDKWLHDTLGLIRSEKQNIVDQIGDSQFHPKLIDDYLSNRDNILASVGGREVPARTGRVLQSEMIDGEPATYLSDEVQLTDGKTIYQGANIQPATRKFLQKIDGILSDGTLSGEQYRTLDKQLSLRLARTDLPQAERELLLNSKNLVDEQANLSLGEASAQEFRKIKAREAMTYKLFDNGYVNDSGMVIPGAFSRNDYYNNNWDSSLPEVTEISNAHNRVRTMKAANLSSNDIVAKIFGRNPVENAFSLYGSRFMNGFKQNPIGDFIAGQYYSVPKYGIPEDIVSAVAQNTTKNIVSHSGSPEFDQRLADFADKKALKIDENGNVIKDSVINDVIDATKNAGAELKYQAQDNGLVDKDLEYAGEKIKRTFNKYKDELRSRK